MQFFTRIEYMTLQPGNKSAGFFLSIASQALQVLADVPVSEAELEQLLADARDRVAHSGLLPPGLVADVGFSLYTGAVPKVFWVEPRIGGSMGAQPGELQQLLDPARRESLGDELTYSPHNVDMPAQALVLMILQQTWAEWAYDKLLLAESLKLPKDISHDPFQAK